MLDLLHIENIAIIEQADIAFRPGFNALTGETGAGKSIVIDALSAVLGQRASRELIRTGADHAFVSAVFSHIPEGLGEDLGVADAQEWLLQREIYTDGKNVCRCNGRPMTVTQLRTLGSRLLNIHGQHDGQQLLDETQHIVYLDQYGRYEPLQLAYSAQFSVLQDIRRKISDLEMNEAEKSGGWTRCGFKLPSWSGPSCSRVRTRSSVSGEICCVTARNSSPPYRGLTFA